ncbi:MAG: histidine kinase [Lachnospiraceae bacterium]|nr:histidine kinase [Lachnospiraceae bacterium]
MIKLTAHDMGAEPSPKGVKLCPRAKTYRYYLVNGSSGFFSGILFIAMAFFLSLVSLIIDFKPMVCRAGLFASGFFLCFAILLLDAGGHYLIFTQNQAVWNIVREFATYLLPFFVLLFFREMEIAKLQRAVILGGAAKDIVFALVAAVLGFSGVMSFDMIAAIYHYSLIVDGVIGIYGVYWNIKNPRIPAGQKTILFVIVGWVAALCVSFVASRVSPVFVYTPDFDFFGLVAILVFYVFIFMFMELIFAAEREFWQMEKELELTRTKNFNSQMQPHFLYNALSSIRQIVYEDPNYAADLITDFTRHLRGTIRAMSGNQFIPLSEELKNIKAYVSIEKVRFGENLTVDYDIQADDFEIIPLSVQPLIENAIRHGIYRRGEIGGVVTLRSAEAENQWIIQVIDTGIGFDVQKVLGEIDAGKRDSAGLKNLIFRLEKLMAAKVQIESVINEGTTITVSIPKRVEGKQ